MPRSSLFVPRFDRITVPLRWFLYQQLLPFRSPERAHSAVGYIAYSLFRFSRYRAPGRLLLRTRSILWNESMHLCIPICISRDARGRVCKVRAGSLPTLTNYVVNQSHGTAEVAFRSVCRQNYLRAISLPLNQMKIQCSTIMSFLLQLLVQPKLPDLHATQALCPVHSVFPPTTPSCWPRYARLALCLYSVSYTHLTLPTKRIV